MKEEERMGGRVAELEGVFQTSWRRRNIPYWDFRRRTEGLGTGPIDLGLVAEVEKGNRRVEWRKDRLGLVLAAAFAKRQLAAAAAAHSSGLLAFLNDLFLCLGSNFRAAAVPRAAAVGNWGAGPVLP